MNTTNRLFLIAALICPIQLALAETPTETSKESSLAEVDALQWVSQPVDQEEAATPVVNDIVKPGTTAKSPVLLPATVPGIPVHGKIRQLSNVEPVIEAGALKQFAISGSYGAVDAASESDIEFESPSYPDSTSSRISSRRSGKRRPAKPKAKDVKKGKKAIASSSRPQLPPAVVTKEFSFRFIEQVQYNEDLESISGASDSRVQWKNDRGDTKPYWRPLRIAQSDGSGNRPSPLDDAASGKQAPKALADTIRELLESTDDVDDVANGLDDSDESEDLDLTDPVPQPIVNRPTNYAATLGDVLMDPDETEDPRIEQQFCDEMWQCAGGRCQNSYDRLTREMRRNSLVRQGNCGNRNGLNQGPSAMFPPQGGNRFLGTR